MVSDFLTVRTAFPSMEKVRVSGCQSICKSINIWQQQRRSFGLPCNHDSCWMCQRGRRESLRLIFQSLQKKIWRKWGIHPNPYFQERNPRMTPCQKKLLCPSVVFAPGNSQSISSLTSLIVIKAVTTPPQRPVLTEQKKMNTGPRQFKF